MDPRSSVPRMDLFFNKIFQEIISVYCFVCSLITLAQNTIMRVDFYATHITRITSVRDFSEFLGTFRYTGTEFYLKICFTDYFIYKKR